MNAVFTKYKWIDALRGYAILLVILIHTSEFFVGEDFSLGFLTINGAYGVTLFFIASSFTLFNSYQSRHVIDGKNAMLFFFIRRFFRIAPLYYLVGIFSVCIGFFFKSYWIKLPINLSYLAVNFLFLNGLYFPSLHSIPLGGWSIGVEMLFYLTIPFLFSIIKNTRQALFLLACSLIASAIIQILIFNLVNGDLNYSWLALRQTELYSWFPNQFPVFCFGILFYFVSKTDFKLEWWFIFLAIGLILFIFMMDFTYAFPNCMLQKEYFLAFAFCLFGLALSITKSGLLINPFIRLGKVSFSAYLIHFFVIEMIVRLFKICFGMGITSNINYVIVYVLVVVVTYLISSQTFTIEQFGIKKGEALINLILKRQKAKPNI